MKALLLFTLTGLFAASMTIATQAAEEKVPHIVFITGDEEYRSEESMPMLAKILKRDYGFKVTVCYSLAEDGTIDPDNLRSITGIEALDDADLMVLFTRFRDLPDEQFNHFLNYVKTGKPIVGFRTATHAFKFDNNKKHSEWGWRGEKIAQLLGQNWITHHGHFGDGHQFLTNITIAPGEKQHPILRGVKPFQAYSWLYHVQGGGDKLRGDAQPLMIGRALISGHEKAGKTDRYPLTNPVAWTKTYEGNNGVRGRVFFSTAAHPFDFKDESARKLSINGMLWALGMEDRIPAEGANVEFVGEYDPNNSGYGNKPNPKDRFKPNRKPEEI
ncbi:Trehalose utilization [Symmachiella macrocystis]|uniref:Trehalose utilization n=1 Tax=Symmachiella macrocystis TaxID=2527985 RepID=A0A5C6BJA9_9PLAN|nr:ThuA domain-containing protein [Symmachiella macrocystis]TWU11631.1 Trehalose utilization [Symmachiella macrocystis]